MPYEGKELRVRWHVSSLSRRSRRKSIDAMYNRPVTVNSCVPSLTNSTDVADVVVVGVVESAAPLNVTCVLVDNDSCVAVSGIGKFPLGLGTVLSTGPDSDTTSAAEEGGKGEELLAIHYKFELSCRLS